MIAQIDPDNIVSLIDPEQANPGGGWEIVRPLLEDAGYLFVELDDDDLPGTHYDRETGEFYTPGLTPSPPEPTELDRINEKLDAHSQLLFQLGMASIAPPAPEEIPEPPAIPDTPDPSSLPPVPKDMSLDPDLLLGLMEGAPTPPELP